MTSAHDKHGDLIRSLRWHAAHFDEGQKVRDTLEAAAEALSARSATDSTQEPFGWYTVQRNIHDEWETIFAPQAARPEGVLNWKPLYEHPMRGTATNETLRLPKR